MHGNKILFEEFYCPLYTITKYNAGILKTRKISAKKFLYGWILAKIYAILIGQRNVTVFKRKRK